MQNLRKYQSLIVINITVSCYVDDGSLYLCRMRIYFFSHQNLAWK